jgi:ubiquinone/menaquinone biosynthesis C-methylase UbiE
MELPHAPNYKALWDAKASTPLGAMLAVDGSTNEDVVRLTGAYSARQVEAALDLRAGDRVLELGCGIGRIGRELAGKVAHWEGTDISANMLGVARDRLSGYPNVGLTELTRSNFKPLPTASFDKAYCVAVFIHMDKEDFYLYLEDMARVLKPGGLLYFDAWNLTSRVGWRRFAAELVQYRDVVPAQRKDIGRNQFTGPEEVRMFLDQAGFDILGLYADSPWVQAVAQRRGADAAVAEAERARVAAEVQRIVYPPLWTELFDNMIKVQSEGTLTPQAALDAMRDDSRGEEIALFRTAFVELWRHHQDAWGPLPADVK